MTLVLSGTGAALAQSAPVALDEQSPAAEPPAPARAALFALTSTAQPPSVPVASSLEPVVVSGSGGAARRAFDTPYAVDVVDREALRAGGWQVNLSESLARVPGLTVNARNNYAQDLQISSRGFGARSTFGVRGLRLYTDGIPASTPDGQGQVSHFDLAGAERVEVLRGPFSVLYGNSSGGVISLVTASPRERQVGVDVDVGSHGTRQWRLSAEAPLGEGWDVRGSLSRFHTDGFRPQSEADRTLGSLRLGWRGELDTLVATLTHLDQPAQDPLGLTRAQVDADPDQTTPQALDFDTRKQTEHTQAGLQWRHRFATGGPLHESVVTVYTGRRGVTQWQAIPVATQANPRHPGGVIDFDRSFEGVDGRVSWQWELGERYAELVLGAATDAQDEHRRGYENYTGDPAAPVLGTTGALRRNERNHVRTVDGYVQGRLDFSPAWSATLGLRSGTLRLGSNDLYLSNGNDSGGVDYAYTNPAVALQWRPDEALAVYLSAGRGFESPTLGEIAYRPDGQPGFNRALKPQTSRQVELGAKWRTPASGLSLDVALFRADTTNEIGVLQNAGGRATYQNVGRTERRGLEIGARWQATSTLRTVLALTWLDATYRDGFLTCTATPCFAADTPVPAGNRIAGTAARSAYAEVAWHASDATELAAELRAQGDVPGNDLNSDYAAGSVIGALRASHTLPLGGGALELLARVDNVGDVHAIGSVIVNEGNQRYFEPAAGRTLMVGAHWKKPF